MHCWSHLAFSTSKAAAVLLQDTLFRRIWHTINGGGLVTLRPLNPLFFAAAAEIIVDCFVVVVCCRSHDITFTSVFIVGNNNNGNQNSSLTDLARFL